MASGTNPKLPNTDPLSSANLSDRGRNFAVAHFDHVENHVGLAATTATLLVAADALTIGAWWNLGLSKLEGQLPTAERMIGEFAIAFLVAGLLFALMAVFPKVGLPWHERHGVKGLFFFGTIGGRTFEKYWQDFLATDGAGLDKELVHQVWGKSRWLVGMFRFIRLAVTCIVLGVLLAMETVLFWAHSARLWFAGIVAMIAFTAVVLGIFYRAAKDQ